MTWLIAWMIGFVVTMVALPLIVDKEDLSPISSIIFCVSWFLVLPVYAYTFIKVSLFGDDDDNEMG